MLQKIVHKLIFSDCCPSWPPNWLQHGLPKLAQNRPKTFKIDHKSVKAHMTLQNCPQTHKNLQKSVKNFQNCTYMAASHEDMSLSPWKEIFYFTTPTWLSKTVPNPPKIVTNLHNSQKWHQHGFRTLCLRPPMLRILATWKRACSIVPPRLTTFSPGSSPPHNGKRA